METANEIRQIICKWNSSLGKFGKIDQWQFESDIASIDRYTSSCEASPCTNALRRIMYFATTTTPDKKMLQEALSTGIKKLTEQIGESKYSMTAGRSHIADTYQYATKRVFNEKLRFKDNRYLRNIDPIMEDGETARKVRRIVEKRMCQEYYRMRKGCSAMEGRRDRFAEIRATSYQMQNLGQIEEIEGLTRTEATHWKRSYDYVTGKVVLKPKKSFETLEEAEADARKRNRRLEKGCTPYTAYRCAYCGKYHIGHKSASCGWKASDTASADRNLYDGHSFAF